MKSTLKRNNWKPIYQPCEVCDATFWRLRDWESTKVRHCRHFYVRYVNRGCSTHLTTGKSIKASF